MTRGKKIKGRKRHLLVDTAGRLLTVLVHAANVPEAVGAEAVLARARDLFPTIRKVWADSAYHTEGLTIWVAEHWPALDLEIVRRPKGTKGFVVQPRRWVVERTFAWLVANRLLAKEYAPLPQCCKVVGSGPEMRGPGPMRNTTFTWLWSISTRFTTVRMIPRWASQSR